MKMNFLRRLSPVGGLFRPIAFFVALVVVGSCIPDRIAVSPNNNEIAMTLKPSGSGPIRVLGMTCEVSNGMDLYIYRLRDKQLIRLTSNGLCNLCPDFSPDGRYVVYCSGDASGESGAEIKVMRLEDRSGTTIARGFWPDWSPRSDRIAFVAREKRPEAANETYRLCVTDSKGQDTFVVYESALPVWGWDSAGKNLYYAAQTEETATTTVFSFDVETRAVQRVFEIALPLARRHSHQIACSSDSRYLALTVDSEHGDGVAILDLTANKVQYLDNERADGFQWDVRDPKFSPSGTLSVSFGYDPWYVFLYKCSEGTWQRVKEIRAGKDDKSPGYWGNHAWLTLDGKEKMLVGYGQTDETNDFYELHLIDAETGQLERNLTKEIAPLLGDAAQNVPPTP